MFCASCDPFMAVIGLLLLDSQPLELMLLYLAIFERGDDQKGPHFALPS